MIHLNGHSVCSSIRWQINVVPIGAQVLFAVRCLQRQSKGSCTSRTVWNVEGDWSQELDALWSAHDERRQHCLTCEEHAIILITYQWVLMNIKYIKPIHNQSKINKLILYMLTC